MTDFNQERFKELLKEQHQSSWDSSGPKASELRDYLVLLEADIFWQSRYEYFEIIEDFLNKRISGQEFKNQYRNVRNKNLTESDLKKTTLEYEDEETDLQINHAARNFTKIVSSLFSFLDIFEPELEDSQSSVYGISEGVLREVLKNDILPRIYQYCKQS